MKKRSAFLAIFLAMPFALFAQSVTTGALSTDTFCYGSTITVNYTASGAFGAKNVFTVQLSAPDGSFSPSFQNIGQVKSTTSGSITATLPVIPGTQYRLRVASSNPYVVGNDNGSNIAVADKPIVIPIIANQRYYSYLIGDTLQFFPENNQDGGPPAAGLSYSWNFGAGAVPATSSDSAVSVTYTTVGTKTFSVTATNATGCSGGPTDTIFQIHLYGCNPSIPSDAYIDSVDASTDNGSLFPAQHDIWVVPGGILNATPYGNRTIYVEAGGTVANLQYGSGLYLKPGAVITNAFGTIIYSPGAGLNGVSWAALLECNSLSFDYTNAPPYKIISAAVGQTQSNSDINIYPNPASNFITIESPEVPSSITVRNDLGEEVLHDAGPIATTNLEFDVSKFASGVYYAELQFGNRKETVKFTVTR